MNAVRVGLCGFPAGQIDFGDGPIGGGIGVERSENAEGFAEANAEIVEASVEVGWIDELAGRDALAKVFARGGGFFVRRGGAGERAGEMERPMWRRGKCGFMAEDAKMSAVDDDLQGDGRFFGDG